MVYGYVKNIYIKEGQAVKKGQLILKLDDQVLKQSIEAIKNTACIRKMYTIEPRYCGTKNWNRSTIVSAKTM